MNLDIELCFANLLHCGEELAAKLVDLHHWGDAEHPTAMGKEQTSSLSLSLSLPLDNMILVCKHPKNRGQSKQKME